MANDIPEEKTPKEILDALSNMGRAMSTLEFILSANPMQKSELVLLVEVFEMAGISISAIIRYMDCHDLNELKR